MSRPTADYVEACVITALSFVLFLAVLSWLVFFPTVGVLFTFGVIK